MPWKGQFQFLFWHVEITVMSLIPHASHMARCCGTLTITMWITILQHDKKGCGHAHLFPFWHDFHMISTGVHSPAYSKHTPPKILGSCGSPKCSCCVTTHPTWWPHWDPHDVHMISTCQIFMWIYIHLRLSISWSTAGNFGFSWISSCKSTAEVFYLQMMLWYLLAEKFRICRYILKVLTSRFLQIKYLQNVT